MPTKPHFVVDPQFVNSKEVLSIPRRYRLAAVGAWTAAGAWSTDKLTDGWVPVTALRELLVTVHIVELLFASTLWVPGAEPSQVARTSDVWTTRAGRVAAIQFEQWGKWQKTKEQWLLGNRGNAERQRRLRERRSAEDTEQNNGVTRAVVTPLRVINGNPAQDGRNGVSNAPRRGEKREVKSGGLVQSVGPPDQPPPPTPLIGCVKHPGGTSDPCADCRRVRLQTGADADHAAITNAAARQLELTRKSRCTACDPNGLRYADPTDWDSPLIRCDHPDIP